MSLDLFNGLFEFIGGILLFRNCWLTFKAKTVKGVSVFTTTFFASWGLWNLWYYPSLEQMWSFAGGCVIVTANVFWIGLMVYYRQLDRLHAPYSRRLTQADKDRKYGSAYPPMS